MNDLAALHIVGSLEGGGAERWVRELVPRLNARNMPCEIATIYPPRLDAAGLHQIGCAIHHRPKRPGFDMRQLIWLRGLIAARKPIIVHTHQWAGKYVGRSAAILAGTPVIIHTEHSPLPVGKAERLMAFALSLRTDAVISFDDHKAHLIRARERVANFEIIRNGIPIVPEPNAEARRAARRKLSIADGTVVFGVVASLQERKNPSLALRSFAAICGEGTTPARLDFFGDGPLRATLEAQARSLGVAASIRFHGFRSDVRELLPGLDVFVTLATQEMAPISMLEAMAARLPIVGAPHPGTIEMLQHDVNGSIVGWDDVEVAAAMRAARDDEPWRERCGVAGRHLVESSYDIEDIADRHVALYRRMLASSGRTKRAASHPASPVPTDA